MDKENPEHPVAKTVEAWQTFLVVFSEENALIYEPFMGSGTTLVVCHRTGRRCYGVEIAPRYGDVILRRAEAEGLTVEREQ
jgi:DNA modification methylase